MKKNLNHFLSRKSLLAIIFGSILLIASSDHIANATPIIVKGIGTFDAHIFTFIDADAVYNVARIPAKYRVQTTKIIFKNTTITDELWSDHIFPQFRYLQHYGINGQPPLTEVPWTSYYMQSIKALTVANASELVNVLDAIKQETIRLFITENVELSDFATFHENLPKVVRMYYQGQLLPTPLPGKNLFGEVTSPWIEKFTANAITDIPPNCFNNCENMRYIYFLNVDKVSARAFANCAKISKLYRFRKNFIYAADAFTNSGLAEVYKPNNSNAYNTYSISINYNSAGGSVSLIGESILPPGSNIDIEPVVGVSTAFMIVPATGYYISAATFGGQSNNIIGELAHSTPLLAGASATFTCNNTDVDDNKTLSITFSKQKYSIEKIENGGTINITAGSTDNQTKIEHQTALTFSVTPPTNKDVVSVKYQVGANTEIPLTLTENNIYTIPLATVTGNITITTTYAVTYVYYENANSIVESVQNPYNIAKCLVLKNNFDFTNLVSKIAQFSSPANTATTIVIEGNAIIANDLANLKNLHISLMSLTNIRLENYTGALPEEMFFIDGSANTWLASFTANSAISVGNKAFANCTNLSNLSLNSVTSIGNYAFQNCSSLIYAYPTNILNFPSVTSVGTNAFADCSSLQTVNFTYNSNNVATITFGAHAFKGCAALTFLNLPSPSATDATVTLGNGIFMNCTTLEHLDGGYNHISSVGDSAFYGCTAFASAGLGTVVSIGNYAFWGCIELLELKCGLYLIPQIELSVGEAAFSNCPKLKDITFYTNIGAWGNNVLGGTTITTNISLELKDAEYNKRTATYWGCISGGIACITQNDKYQFKKITKI